MICLNAHVCTGHRPAWWQCNLTWSLKVCLLYIYVLHMLTAKRNQLYMHSSNIYNMIRVPLPPLWLWLSFSACLLIVKIDIWWYDENGATQGFIIIIHFTLMILPWKLTLCVFSFCKAVSRWQCVTGHKSEIPAEVMSALCIMCCCFTLWRHVHTWSQLFQATHASITQKIYHKCK